MTKTTFDMSVKELREWLKGRLERLCVEVGLKKTLKESEYYTIELVESKISRKGKVYRYAQLKGVKGGKCKTLANWKIGSEPRRALMELVKTYRALKHLGHLEENLMMMDFEKGRGSGGWGVRAPEGEGAS